MNKVFYFNKIHHLLDQDHGDNADVLVDDDHEHCLCFLPHYSDTAHLLQILVNLDVVQRTLGLVCACCSLGVVENSRLLVVVEQHTLEAVVVAQYALVAVVVAQYALLAVVVVQHILVAVVVMHHTLEAVVAQHTLAADVAAQYALVAVVVLHHVHHVAAGVV